ncbi:MAG: AAA family ATPase [Planctomycetota bacterium]
MTDERETERAVSLGAEIQPDVYASITRCDDLGALATQLDEQPSPVALVDIDTDPMGMLSRIEPLVTRFPQTRFVVICRDMKSEIVLEAMQIGARHCLVKQTIADDLPGVLRRLMNDASTTATASGRVVTVLSASGGCGATTIAINLAEELRLHTSKPTLLVDLDAHYGAVATYLGLSGEFGIADVLSQRGSIDGGLVTSTASVYAEDLHVLLSPASVNFSEPAPLQWNQLDKALSGCKQAFNFTVVDAPRVPMSVAADLAKSSVLTLIVFELGVIDIRSTRAILTALTDRRVPVESILPVANRYRKRSPMLSLEDARDALGGMSIGRVSNDFSSVVRSINYGQPVAKVAPRSALRNDIHELVTLVEAQISHNGSKR